MNMNAVNCSAVETNRVVAPTQPTCLARPTNWPGGLVMAWEDCVILSISHSENEYEPGSRTQTIHLVL